MAPRHIIKNLRRCAAPPYGVTSSQLLILNCTSQQNWAILVGYANADKKGLFKNSFLNIKLERGWVKTIKLIIPNIFKPQ